jgi:membrane-associated PAP2 superfamily phosphatase
MTRAPGDRRRAVDPATVALLAGLALVLLWDLSGLDLVVGRWFGDARGFALREHPVLSAVLHDGLRRLGLAVLAVWAVRLVWRRHAPGVRHEALWFGVVLVTAITIPLIKRWSDTSCPWDLAEFGGAWPYVPHLDFGRGDGGPGGCFPSGHAVSAFGFVGAWFAWRNRDPRLARILLGLVLVAGVLAGGTQVVRGAHHVSHVLWTAWICLAIAWTADRLVQRRRSANAAAAAEPSAEHRVADRVTSVEQQPQQRALGVVLPDAALDDELPAADPQRVAQLGRDGMPVPEGRHRDLGLPKPRLVVGGECEHDAKARGVDVHQGISRS